MPRKKPIPGQKGNKLWHELSSQEPKEAPPKVRLTLTPFDVLSMRDVSAIDVMRLRGGGKHARSK